MPGIFPSQLTSRPWATPSVTRRPGAFHQSQYFPEPKLTNKVKAVDTKTLFSLQYRIHQNKNDGCDTPAVKQKTNGKNAKGRCFPGKQALLRLLQLRLLRSRTHPLALRIRIPSWTGSPVFHEASCAVCMCSYLLLSPHEAAKMPGHTYTITTTTTKTKNKT